MSHAADDARDAFAFDPGCDYGVTITYDERVCEQWADESILLAWLLRSALWHFELDEHEHTSWRLTYEGRDVEANTVGELFTLLGARAVERLLTERGAIPLGLRRVSRDVGTDGRGEDTDDGQQA